MWGKSAISIRGRGTKGETQCSRRAKGKVVEKKKRFAFPKSSFSGIRAGAPTFGRKKKKKRVFRKGDT